MCIKCDSMPWSTKKVGVGFAIKDALNEPGTYVAVGLTEENARLIVAAVNKAWGEFMMSLPDHRNN